MPLFLRIMKCLSRKDCSRMWFEITLKMAEDGDVHSPPPQACMVSKALFSSDSRRAHGEGSLGKSRQKEAL